MKEFTYVIKDELGIHARPAGLLVKTCASFSSSVTFSVNGKTADGKKLIRVMSLGAKKGDEIAVRIEGEDENSASQFIEAFFRDNL